MHIGKVVSTPEPTFAPTLVSALVPEFVQVPAIGECDLCSKLNLRRQPTYVEMAAQGLQRTARGGQGKEH